MHCNCPNCSSEATQLLSVIYSSGIITSESTTRRESTSRHTHTTVTVSQSDLSRQIAPPEKLSVLFPIKLGGITALLLPSVLRWLLPQGPLWEILIFGAFLAVIGGSIYAAYWSFKYNRTDWATTMEQWCRQYFCSRCGTVFEPRAAGIKSGD